MEPVDPGFGKMYGPGPHYVVPPILADGDPEYLCRTPVWMWRRGQRVRFFDAQGNQVGPEHKNVVPALIYAAANCWIDPEEPWWSLCHSLEVLGQIGEKRGTDWVVAQIAGQP
jgi:hypothetical protein